MTFVALDNKDWCKGIYHQGQLVFDRLPENLKRTWKYSSYLSDRDVLYASLYAQGRGIDDVCPPQLAEEWQYYKKRLKAYHNSFVEAKVDLEQNCFFDLVPDQFLLELCETKVKIINNVFETTPKPENYDLLLGAEKIIHDIGNRELNVDLSPIKDNLHDTRARALMRRLKGKNKVSYNLFGSKTGRLSINPGTFPILNLDKEYKSILKPQNDLFLELDFNAAEVRTLLALSGQEQPKEDIHEWNAKRLGMTREEVKKEIFSWLYGSKKVDGSKYENLFKLNKIMNQFYDGSIIKNLFNRKIKSDQFHSLNYLIQSTTSDLVLEQLVKINKLILNKTSFISFLVHDSVVIDLSREDRELVNLIVETFSDTRLGRFPVNISAGKNYGEMRKL